MPTCDAYIPTGALPEAAERALLSKFTDLLLQHEGALPPARPRALAWAGRCYGAQRLAGRRRERAPVLENARG